MNPTAAGEAPVDQPVVPLVARLRREADAWGAGSGDVAALLREAADELHNLAWALSLPGFDRMATDEQEAEHQAGMQRVNAMLKRMEKAKAERDAMEIDAERYRWLRAQHWDSAQLCVVMDPKDAVKLGRTCPSGEYLDIAVDDAMRHNAELTGKAGLPDLSGPMQG